MLRSVFGKTLHEARRSLLAWSAGVFALVATLLAMYPTVRTGDYQRTIESSSEGLLRAFGMQPGTDVASGNGYLGGYLFGFMLPLLLIIFAISTGARAVAGEEDAGTIDLLATMPISRTRVVAEKFAAFAVLIVALAVTVDVFVLAGAPLVDLHVAWSALIVTTAGHTLVAVLFGAVAMAAGAATGSRALARPTSSPASVSSPPVMLCCRPASPGTSSKSSSAVPRRSRRSRRACRRSPTANAKSWCWWPEDCPMRK